MVESSLLTDYPGVSSQVPAPPWKFWSGEELQSSPESPLSFDTETTVVDLSREIPRLVLASASDGRQTFIIRPEDLPHFLDTHDHSHFAGHNLASFDFWAVEQELRRQQSIPQSPCWKYELHQTRMDWWNTAEEGRLHDSMLLDMLVMLARGEGEDPNKGEGRFRKRALWQLATHYGSTYQFTEAEKGKKKGKRKKADEEDEDTQPLRMRYGELLDVEDWTTLPSDWFDYPAKDAFTCWEVYRKLYQEALSLFRPFDSAHDGSKDVFPGCVQEFGILTEKVQVLGAIALAQVGRNGIRVNTEAAALLEAEWRSQIQSHQDYLLANHRELFSFWKKGPRAGQIKVTPKAQTPSLSHKGLQATLTAISGEKGLPLLISDGKKKEVSVSWKAWAEHQEAHPFLRAWVGQASMTKLLEFFALFKAGDTMHPRYNPLVRTGRCSAEDRIQQIPQVQDFRSLFIPRPGYKMMTCDYAGVELRMWAAICLHKFGHSEMAKVFSRPPPHDDAHSYTTSLILNEDFDHVLAHKKEECFNRVRKLSKALIFGRMGGLGPDKFVGYAKAKPYFVTVTSEESRDLINKLHEVYPELDNWLAGTSLQDFSLNLGIDRGWLEDYLDQQFSFAEPDMVLRCLSNVLWGKPFKADGRSYAQRWIDQLWRLAYTLLTCCTKQVPEAVFRQVVKKDPSPKLYEYFARGHAVTPTGRIRSGVIYTEAKNGPFQGLAADGMKLAMFDLIKAGCRVVGSIHDELIVELPEETAGEQAKVVNTLMCNAMNRVVRNMVPISTEYKLDDHWSK